MLIVTADDYGRNKLATDRILEVFLSNRITSASGMVFMQDSERAASLALDHDLEMGLHLNFTEAFSACNVPVKLREHQSRVRSFLTKNKWFQIAYNPLLADSFRFLFMSQRDEFIRLYKRPPDHYNGHHHMHLCANVLVGALLPSDTPVRGTFTFDGVVKNPFKLLYRLIVGSWITKRFISTDGFFSIVPINNQKRLRSIIIRAAEETIEIEVHPENLNEMNFLLSDQYQTMVDSIDKGGFRRLHHNLLCA